MGIRKHPQKSILYIYATMKFTVILRLAAAQNAIYNIISVEIICLL
jgi:hypothetical protein